MIPRTIIGYHGCDVTLAESVISGAGELPESTNTYDWLGGGVYFWEDSYARAWQWAQERCSRRGRGKPAVIGAVIHTGNCLNLIDPASVLVVEQAYRTYVKLCRQNQTAPAKNQGKDMLARYLDCEVFNTLHQTQKNEGIPSFDTIRAFFTEGKPIYKGAGLRKKDHVQVVVRNPDCIIGYFLPRKAVTQELT